eukprot:TRINITY_DN8688_c0_g1_i1.p5 TRINITY_DN8688_c0_g1~~TRINITY_DN8688_c0_g1_i1.p5  ORF type:complete len:106 (+),score=12.47 TRINITY_DN8688_c0_g1_i1:3-320(+)
MVQPPGADKALFRALRGKQHGQPRYGPVYHESLAAARHQEHQKQKQQQQRGETKEAPEPAKHRGRISRLLATKAALSSRVDALGEGTREETWPPNRSTPAKFPFP